MVDQAGECRDPALLLRLHSALATRYVSGQTDAVDVSVMQLLEAVSSCRLPPDRRRLETRLTLAEAILRIIVVWPGTTTDEISDRLKGDRSAASSALDELAGAGMAHRIDGEPGWHPGPSIGWLQQLPAREGAS